MQRTHIYIPDDLQHEIDIRAKRENKPKAAIIREALKKGLEATSTGLSSSAKALTDLAKMAKKFHGSAPKDLSANHDYYTWGGKKKNVQLNDK